MCEVLINGVAVGDGGDEAARINGDVQWLAGQAHELKLAAGALSFVLESVENRDANVESDLERIGEAMHAANYLSGRIHDAVAEIDAKLFGRTSKPSKLNGSGHHAQAAE